MTIPFIPETKLVSSDNDFRHRISMHKSRTKRQTTMQLLLLTNTIDHQSINIIHIQQCCSQTQRKKGRYKNYQVLFSWKAHLNEDTFSGNNTKAQNSVIEDLHIFPGFSVFPITKLCCFLSVIISYLFILLIVKIKVTGETKLPLVKVITTGSL